MSVTASSTSGNWQRPKAMSTRETVIVDRRAVIFLVGGYLVSQLFHLASGRLVLNTSSLDAIQSRPSKLSPLPTWSEGPITDKFRLTPS